MIDMGILPFERQIGQTGKTVAPRLLIACGVSGANELTVGFEDAGVVVAINTDQRARIFRFADLSIVGDVQQVLPLLLSRLQNQKDTNTLPC
jgi:electron transfer flavoprotein alpha subunit